MRRGLRGAGVGNGLEVERTSVMSLPPPPRRTVNPVPVSSFAAWSSIGMARARTLRWPCTEFARRQPSQMKSRVGAHSTAGGVLHGDAERRRARAGFARKLGTFNSPETLAISRRRVGVPSSCSAKDTRELEPNAEYHALAGDLRAA